MRPWPCSSKGLMKIRRESVICGARPGVHPSRSWPNSRHRATRHERSYSCLSSLQGL
jgi:hypothetical protein